MTVPVAMASIQHELAAIVGDAHASDDPQRVEALAIDGVLPRAVVSPASPEEVATVLKLASQRGWVAVPAGRLTAQAIGNIPEQVDVVLQTHRLDAVEHYDPRDLTIGVGAGMRLGDLQQRLAEHGQMLPIDPPQAAHRSVGGVLATAASGPLKHAFGTVREFCIGIQFVTGDGLVAKGGGRVVKNVAGYDLMKLLIGSHGTLGVITSASFKVFPRPRQTRTFVLEFLLSTGAVQFRDRLLRSHLTFLAAEVVSPRAAEYIVDKDGRPTLVAQHLRDRAGSIWRLVLRAAGSDAVLSRYRNELGHYVVQELEGEAEFTAWSAVCEFQETVLARHRNAMLVQVSAPIEALGVVLKAAEESGLQNNFLTAIIGRFCAGSTLVAFIPLAVDPPAAIQYVNAISAFRGALPRDSSAVVVRCPREAKPHFSVWGATPTDVDAMRAVKRALDPAAILNRGRFLL